MKNLTEAPRTDPDLVEGLSMTPTPMNKYVSQGAKIPTPYVLKYNGRKSRVYRAVYDGMDAMWIRNDGHQLFLDKKTIGRIAYSG